MKHATATYTVTIVYSASQRTVGDYPSLAAAKAAARNAWDQKPGMHVEIFGGAKPVSISSSQPHGAGMLWK